MSDCVSSPAPRIAVNPASWTRVGAMNRASASWTAGCSLPLSHPSTIQKRQRAGALQDLAAPRRFLVTHGLARNPQSSTFTRKKPFSPMGESWNGLAADRCGRTGACGLDPYGPSSHGTSDTRVAAYLQDCFPRRDPPPGFECTARSHARYFSKIGRCAMSFGRPTLFLLA